MHSFINTGNSSCPENLKGILFTVQKALPLLDAGASVIITESTAASGGAPAFSVYAASKASLLAFTRNWIIDLKGRNIRIKTLSPGPIKTPGLLGLAGPDAVRQQALVESLAASVPLERSR